MPRHFSKAMMNPRYKGHMYKMTDEYKFERKVEGLFKRILELVKNVLR